jgi:LppP/LprE lipoprotein
VANPAVTEPDGAAPPAVVTASAAGWWSDPRHRLISALVAIVVVAGVVVAAVLAFSGGGSSSPVAVVQPASSSTTTMTSPPSSSPPASTSTSTSRVTPAQIAQKLSSTRDPSTGGTFQGQDSGSSSDGAGGLLTAVTGFDNSANHPPCLVFFWHNATFLGTDASQPHLGCQLLSAQGGQFVVAYDHFGPGDPLCCPSQPPVDITYTWDGQALTPNGTLPPSP